MFTPLTIAACNLNPGDMIRYTNPDKRPNMVNPVMQGVVVGVTVERTKEGRVKMGSLTRVDVRLPITNTVNSYMFPWNQYIDVTGQVSQEALDFMEDFRKFQL